jgi:hypothetical protein
VAAPPRKLTKQVTHYTPKAEMQSERCDLCVHWRAPDACHLVLGLIRPGGWCDRWIKRAGR